MIASIRQICLIALISFLFPLEVGELTAYSPKKSIAQSALYDPLAIPDYELVLAGADHFAFIDGALQRTSPNPNHHRAILALSTAFWDAWLKNDRIAQAWLESDKPRSVLEEGDRWQTK